MNKDGILEEVSLFEFEEGSLFDSLQNKMLHNPEHLGILRDHFWVLGFDALVKMRMWRIDD